MVTAADGTAFTSAVTVYVTLDAGTQAIGTVGSGACTHEGNGYHTYAPSQAETNGDLAAFTFIGTGAIPVTVQVYTSFPQTGDSFARVGAPVGASLSADLAALQADADAAPTPADIADAVWDEAIAGHLGAGSTGEALDDAGAAGTPPTAAAIADAVWDEDATGHQTQGTFGQAIGDPVADTNTIFKAVVTDAAGATVGVDLVAAKADTAAILVDTGTTLDGRIPAALTANGNMKADTLRINGTVVNGNGAGTPWGP